MPEEYEATAIKLVLTLPVIMEKYWGSGSRSYEHRDDQSVSRKFGRWDNASIVVWQQ
jgi:hypothetical protein